MFCHLCVVYAEGFAYFEFSVLYFVLHTLYLFLEFLPLFLVNLVSNIMCHVSGFILLFLNIFVAVLNGFAK